MQTYDEKVAEFPFLLRYTIPWFIQGIIDYISSIPWSIPPIKDFYTVGISLVVTQSGVPFLILICFEKFSRYTNIQSIKTQTSKHQSYFLPKNFIYITYVLLNAEPRKLCRNSLKELKELSWQYTIKLLKSFIVYCQFNSDNGQRQLAEILVLVLISIKLKYVSKNTLYNSKYVHTHTSNLQKLTYPNWSVTTVE